MLYRVIFWRRHGRSYELSKEKIDKVLDVYCYIFSLANSKKLWAIRCGKRALIYTLQAVSLSDRFEKIPPY